MSSIPILRGLTTKAASSARSSLSQPVISWIGLSSRTPRTTILDRRSLSSTSATSYSSPFRLNSNNPPNNPNTTTPSHPEPEPETPLNEHEEPHVYYSPYKPKRQWPPDMSKLSPKHQFRLERKYRRRAALKYARPKWTKATKLVQWGIIGFIVIYAVLFMEWDSRGASPVEDIRNGFFAGLKSIFSAPPAPGPVRRVDEKRSE